jgi:ABC-type lipoprotein export system ATPase subunit
MVTLKKIIVKDSNFFTKDLEITFNEKLNCIMGGRGSGKTTILMLINAVLNNDIEQETQIYSLLKSNLGSSGKIILEIEDDNYELYSIEKVLGEKSVVYTANRNTVTYDNIKESISADFYRASEIENIGKSPDDRLRLIDKSILSEIKDIESGKEIIFNDLKQNKAEISEILSKKEECKNKINALLNVEDDLQRFYSDNPTSYDEDEGDRQKFDIENKNQSLRNEEKRFYQNITLGLENLRYKIDSTITAVSDINTTLKKFSPELNIDIIKEYQKKLQSINDNIQKYLNDSQFSLNQAMILNNESQASLHEKHAIQENMFTAFKNNLEKNRAYYQELNRLKLRIDAKQRFISELKDLQEKYNSLVSLRQEKLNKLKIIYEQISQKRHEVVVKINEIISNGQAQNIKIKLANNLITKNYDDALKIAFKGCGFNYSDICKTIIDPNKILQPIDLSIIILKEDTKILADKLDIDEIKSKKIIEYLLNTQNIFDIETIYCDDLLNFYLKTDQQNGNPNNNYKPTEELSTGQRCTTILPIIFASSDKPLIIDQPEDNLDNKYIVESIHRIISDQKNKRQMIFVTHNPNIPVLCDAEQNIFLGYSNKNSRIEAKGNVEQVKNYILNILEGGKEAFDKRSEIYKDIKINV